MSTATDMSLAATERLAADYGEAWNRHDVEALLAMQSDDMVFHLHVDGSEEVSGTDALRGLYSFFFDVMPDYTATLNRTTIREGLIVLEYTITATLAKPFPIGQETGVPTGTPMRFEAVDVLPCAGGQVLRKDTYVDGVAMRRGMGL